LLEVLFLAGFAAAHGYIAAWLAVRMLFRPHNPVKLWGITVWPQGMIPRHRQKLAQTIGNAVGNELVSQDTIFDALFETDFLRDRIESLIESYTTEALSRAYPSLIEALPTVARAPVLDSVSALQIHLSSYVSSALRSDAMHSAVKVFVDKYIDELFAKRVNDILSPGAFTQISDFFAERFLLVVNEPGFEEKVRSFISARIDEMATSEATIGEMLTADTIRLIKEKVDEQVPPVVHHLAEIATSERTSSQIGALIKREVDAYYEQLSLFKKIFISRDRVYHEVDELVHKNLPRHIEEYLRGEAFEEQAKQFLESTIDNAFSKPINQIVGRISPDKLEMVKDQISQRILLIVRNPSLGTSVHTYMDEVLSRVRPRSIRALLHYVRPEATNSLKSTLSRYLSDVIRREDTARVLNRMVSERIEKLLVTPIGRPSDLLPPETIRHTCEVLTDRIISAARERLPATISEFDVGGIVRRKVAVYPAEKLEALILSVARQHLKTIELFGGVMGFIIGLVQSLFLMAIR
jgi:uncharacterized membrane protein YheB (UPF0754 family)